ncbi:hypothetical protein RSOCI_03840 [Rhabdochlamydiaceae symbiont of Dictyostelium giganteum]
MSIVNSPVNDCMINFSKSFKKFKEIEGNSHAQMEADIKKLYHSLISCKHLLNFKNPHHLPIALKLTEILTSEELQDNDLLKELISKTALIAWELVVFKFIKEDRHIYEKTYNQVSQSIEISLSTLPTKEFQTKFYLQCLRALLEIPERGLGTRITEAKQVLVPLAVAGLQIALAGGSPLAALPALSSPIVEIVKIVSRKIRLQWYQSIWDLNWSFSGNQVKDLNKLKEFALAVNAYKTCNKKLFYIADLYFNIIQNTQIQDHIRQKIFKSSYITPDFITLTTQYELIISKKNISKDKYWQTRLVAIKRLIELSKSELFAQEAFTQIFSILQTETNGIILQYLVDEINNLNLDNQTIKTIVKSVELISMDHLIKKLESEKNKILSQVSTTNQTLTEEVKGLIGMLERSLINLKDIQSKKIQQKNRGTGVNESSLLSPNETPSEDPNNNIKQQEQLLSSMQNFQEALPTMNSDTIINTMNNGVVELFKDVAQKNLIEKDLLTNHMQNLETLKNIYLSIEAYNTLNENITTLINSSIAT